MSFFNTFIYDMEFIHFPFIIILLNTHGQRISLEAKVKRKHKTYFNNLFQ